MATKKTAKKPAKKPSKSAKKPVAKSAKKPAKKPAAKPANNQRKKPAGGDDRWWSLIERSGKGAEDGDEHADNLVELLSKELTDTEILAFDRFLGERIRDAFRGDLWAVAYIMNGGCSDDGFDYFIGWLIARGRKHYEAALAKPEAAATGVDPDDEPFENEMIWYVASKAWAAKTGKPEDDYYAIAPSVKRTLKGDDFDEDTVYDDHPKLAERFGGG